jgi:hypothetical protein
MMRTSWWTAKAQKRFLAGKEDDLVFYCEVLKAEA